MESVLIIVDRDEWFNLYAWLYSVCSIYV